MTEAEKRVVVITGGSRGIGRAICKNFASSNNIIYFNYFSPSNPEAEAEAAAETERIVAEAGGSAKGICANVAAGTEVSRFFKTVADEAGRIDVLVNNAGITRDGLLVRMSEADWDSVLSVNLKAVFLCIQAVSRIMMKQRSGRIVNIASVVGATGNAGQANYSASKGGVIALTKTAAKELAPRGVTVNAVAPGFIATDMTSVLSDKAREAMLNQVPLGRPGTPEDVAAAVCFLASDGAAYLTGQVIHVNGGMYM